MRAIGLGSFFLLSILISNAQASVPTIYTSKGHFGIEFKNFEFVLTPENTKLPGNAQLYREPLDEHASQFDSGMFEIFIPVTELELPTQCKSYYIARMPMTLDALKAADVKKKQDLYFAIKRMVEEHSGSVRVVFEYPNGCNLYFRSGHAGAYVDYVGQLK